ncbi:putative fibrillin-2 precursor [Neospora caninum Liverpool]|uniref:Putative fibrillin-2 n=1 Tax=Neospora caninum (strain Liverpool) TaxID=572307 RepID=F0VFH0_NEOCL|nr:putative fibrillin-2 precursor [Neospora caninum Liverpool]CBZ52464.1 putative fibrillin-2 precursor [Neospora caninum Liverpool]|eukprot:XP_003882496.1 putative fibrillin-2 precursor [Neospora caninum Liverpool]
MPLSVSSLAVAPAADPRAGALYSPPLPESGPPGVPNTSNYQYLYSASPPGNANGVVFTAPELAPQQAPGFLSGLLPSRSSSGGFLGLNGSGEGSPGIQQLGTLMADIATCDPKTEGVCCLARNYCDPNATCFSDAAPDSVFDILNAIPRCTCKEGFEGDGRTKGTGCSNIDECATGQAGCEQICKDFAPGYACGCYDGYKLKANGKDCQDINECLTANGGCQHVCVNTPGTFFCDCAAGFTLGEDGRSCTDVDECALDENICEHRCENLPGAFQCHCNPGYKRGADDPRKCVDRDDCVDIDECLLAKKLLFSKDREGQGVTPAVRLQQQRELQGGRLLPGRPALCDQKCLNLVGKYECGCYPGFVLQPDGRCDDINECLDPSLHGCEQLCVNLPGTYSCQCRQGYRPSVEKRGACVDIDECAENPALCEYGCTNLPGTYECTCPPDSKPRNDKRGCQPNLSCKEDASQCQGDHVCRLDGTTQKWKCSCPDGFAAAQSSPRNLHPPRCVDINECAVGYPTAGRNPCPDLYRPCCLNVAGGFQCVMARRRGLAANRQLYCEAPSFDFQGRLNR